MRTTDTIVALASGPGPSVRALVRLSGAGVPSLLGAVLRDTGETEGAFAAGKKPSVRAARLVLDGGGVLPVLVLRYPLGRSFTGEASAEILLPGNPALIERVIRTLLVHPDVREATPGEFSARAYLNDRLTLDQAEGVAATIAARTDAQLAAAARLMAGGTGETYRAWAEEIATLLALVEAGIDFTDQEDVVPIPPAELRGRLHALSGAIAATLGSEGGSEAADAAPRVVLAGRPNAGKSTLFNALLGRPRAVVSPAAGTTRDLLAEPLDLSSAVPGGPVVSLIDLAGLDEAAAGAGPAGEIDREAQRRAQDAIRSADVVVHCDPAGRFAQEFAAAEGTPVIRVRTKADLPGGADERGETGTLPVCALDGFNLGPLRRAIADAAWSAHATPGTAALLPRHRRALAQTLERTREAATLLDAAESKGSPSPELLARSLREALDAIGELTGRISPDDVIGRVFSTFCVGK